MKHKDQVPVPGVLLSRYIHPFDLITAMTGADLVAAVTSRGLSGHWGQVASDPDHAAIQLIATVASAVAFYLIGRNARQDRLVLVPVWLGGERR